MTNTTTTIDLTATAAKKAVMKAARHLNASRMAWVANRWTSGIDWRGCTKGHIAESLTTYGDRSAPSVISQESLDTLCYRMRLQPDTNGNAAMIPADATRIAPKVIALRAKAERMADQYAAHQSGEKINYRVERSYDNLTREADRLENLLKLIEHTPEPRDIRDIWKALENVDASKVLRVGHDGCSVECESTHVHFQPTTEN